MSSSVPPEACGRLAGKVALVSGSTTGIGEAIAQRFALEGAQVVVHGISATQAESVARSICDHGGRAVGLAGDLARPSTAERLAEQTREVLGPVDIIVNNAALKTRSNLTSTDAAAFDEIIAVNLRAPLLLIRAFMSHFHDNGRGAVLNMGSVNGYCGQADLLAYSISKGGLMTLSRNLADALAKDRVRVNHLNLGWVLTPSEEAIYHAEGFPDGWAERLPPSIAPTGGLLRPDDIAHFALCFVEETGLRVSGAVVDLEQFPVVGRNPQKVVELLQ